MPANEPYAALHDQGNGLRGILHNGEKRTAVRMQRDGKKTKRNKKNKGRTRNSHLVPVQRLVMKANFQASKSPEHNVLQDCKTTQILMIALLWMWALLYADLHIPHIQTCCRKWGGLHWGETTESKSALSSATFCSSAVPDLFRF